MAFENIGLGAILKFDGSKFIAGVKKSEVKLRDFVKTGKKVQTVLVKIKTIGVAAFRRLGRSMRTMSSGMGKMRAGLQSMTLAFAPLGIGLGLGAKKFIDFQQQMQNVKAISKDISDNEFVQLTKKAKLLGSTTQFTATQAGEGFELMAQQGLTFQDQMAGIGGVLDLAAAGSIELSDAARIAGDTAGAFGLKMTELTRVADVLALTSASTNTNVLQLGEALAKAAPLAATMRVPLEDTAAALGLIANAGIKAGASGTAFKNMLIKLAAPSAKGTKAMKKFKLQIFETDTGALDLNKTMKAFIEGTKGIESATARAKVLVELFGLRAPGAVNALTVAIENGKFDTLPDELMNAAGAAKRMAAVKLDSFQGQMTLLASAAEGFALEFFGPFVEMAEKGLKDTVIPFVQDLVAALQFIQDPTKEGADEFNALGNTVKQVAFGVMEAIKTVTAIIDTVVDKVKALGAQFNARFGPDAIQKITKWVIIFGLVAAAMVPVLIMLVAIGFAISAISTVVSGVATLLSGAWLPILIIGAGLTLLFLNLRKQNESFGETVRRVWGELKTKALDVWFNAILPFWEGIKLASTVLWPQLKRTALSSFTLIKIAVVDLFNTFGIQIGEGETNWLQMGLLFLKIIVRVIIWVLRLAAFFVIMGVTAIKVIKALFEIIVDFMFAPFLMVFNVFQDLRMAFNQILAGDIISGVKRLGQAFLDFLLAPLRLIITTMVKLADAIGLDVPDAVREFATKTFTGRQATLTDTSKPRVGPKVARKAPGFKTPAQLKAEAIASQKEKSKAAEIEAASASIEAALNSVMEKFSGEGSPQADKLKEIADAAKKSPCIETNVSLAVDGGEIARGQARHEAELKDRAGFRNSPWMQRLAAEFGGAPARGKA